MSCSNTLVYSGLPPFFSAHDQPQNLELNKDGIDWDRVADKVDVASFVFCVYSTRFLSDRSTRVLDPPVHGLPWNARYDGWETGTLSIIIPSGRFKR